MINIVGALMCIIGAGGYGISYVITKRREVSSLQIFYRSFLRMKNMLTIDRDFIGEAFLKLGQDARLQNTKIQSFFLKIGQDSENQREIEFSDLWRNEVEKQWLHSTAEKELYDLLYSFPTYIENCDLDSLEQSFSYFLRQWEDLLTNYKCEQRKNEKLVFTVCLFAGLMLSILMI